jgi:glycosyltransferase involved in cell wall biosynthesis
MNKYTKIKAISDNKSINVLILVRNYDGGTGTFTNQMIDMSKISPLVSVNNVISLYKPEFAPSYDSCDVHYVHEYTTKYGSFYNKNPYVYIKEVFKIYSLIKIIKPDIILSIDTHCNTLACILKILFCFHLKVIITNHNNIAEVFSRKLSGIGRFVVKMITRTSFLVADACVCVSKGSAKGFSKFFHYSKKINVIYYGVDGAKNLRKQNAHLVKPLSLLSVGRLDQQKDFTNLIHAFSIIHRKHRNCTLTIVGDGIEKTKLIRYIKALHLTKWVILTHWKNKLETYYSNSDLFILSSHYEGFPYVLLEAMSYGLPIVSTDVDFGPRELLVDGKYGCLVKPNDSVDLAKKCLMVLENKASQKYRKLSLKRIAYFPKSKMLRLYINLILSLLDKNNSKIQI